MYFDVGMVFEYLTFSIHVYGEHHYSVQAGCSLFHHLLLHENKFYIVC